MSVVMRTKHRNGQPPEGSVVPPRALPTSVAGLGSKRVQYVLIVSSVLWLAACRSSEPVTTPMQGTLRVATTTTGSDLDPDGYALQVGDLPPRSISVNGSPQEFATAPGSYRVVLAGLAPNCLLTGAVLMVTVTSGVTSNVPLTVQCSALPGNLRVTVTTGGEDLDFGGYLVSLDGAGSGRIGPNDSLVFTSVPAGVHRVTVGEVASNCSSGTLAIDVDIRHAAEVTALFPLTCIHTAKIAYESRGTIFTMNQDGTGVFAIDSALRGATPVLSPDATQLAIAKFGRDSIYLVRADGTNPGAIPNLGTNASDPAWSPNGLQLAVMVRPATASSYIVTCNLNGTGLTQLTSGAFRDQQPAWSPTGDRIVFVREDYATSVRRLFVINTDGTGLTPLTAGIDDREPAWSPDGSVITFTGQGPTGERRVYLIQSDGSARQSLIPTTTRTWGYSPNWIGNASVLASDGNRLYAVSLATRAELWSLPIGVPLYGVQSISWRP
jgi:hypothetical protein